MEERPSESREAELIRGNGQRSGRRGYLIAALLVYAVGSLWAGSLLVQGLTIVAESWVDGLFVVGYALGVWWITAGVGLRLGMPPRTFFLHVGRGLGFTR